MDITKEKIGDLNVVLKIKLGPSDYSPKVDAAVNDYRRRMTMPGFRPGKVPHGLIRKMYGKSILAEEVRNLLSESLNKYLTENRIDILGQPLPKENSSTIDWAKQKEFEFLFELGLRPEVNVTLPQNEKFTRYRVSVDEEMISKEITDLSRRYGKIIHPETASEADDFLFGEFQELHADGKVKPDGIRHISSLTIKLVEDENTRKKLTGMKKGDSLDVAPSQLSSGASEIASMLGIDKEKSEALTSRFRFTVTNVGRMEEAVLDQAFYDRMFGPGSVKSEGEFRERVRDRLKREADKNSDTQLENDIVEHFVRKTKLSLPDDFLKRWIKRSREKPITDDVLEREYDDYAARIKWQLIEHKLIRDNSIIVSREEALDYAGNMITVRLLMYGRQVPPEEIDRLARELLQNEEEAGEIYDRLFDEKLFSLIKKSVQITDAEIGNAEFLKLVKKSREKKDKGFFNFGLKRKK